ncbi:inorganic anion transporter, SulP family, partial [Ancylostoma duodenale]
LRYRPGFFFNIPAPPTQNGKQCKYGFELIIIIYASCRLGNTRAGADESGLCRSLPTNELHPEPLQDEFDKRYEYTRPAQENLLVAATTKYLAKFIRPCSSFSSFSRTILAFLPILQWVPRYDVKENLLRDVIGGFMVGIMHVPQGIAYALLAGVHPVVGLYTSFFPVIAYMLFGTSRHASIGSFAVVALMTGQTVHRLSRPVVVNVTQTIGDPTEVQYEPVEIASALTLTIGLIQIIVGLVGLDFVTTYFSEQLVAGFTTGASVHVFVTQLKDITGIYGTPRRAGVGNAILVESTAGVGADLHIQKNLIYDSFAFALPYTYEFLLTSGALKRTSDIIVEISRINWTAAAVSAVTMLILITGKKIVNPIVQRRSPVPVPFELLVVILGTIFSAILSLETKYHVAVVGHIPTGLPLPSVPRVEILPHLLKDAISISVVIMAVHISMAKLLAKKYRYPIDTKQEFFAIGLTSTISSFFPVFPSSCSLARTLVNASAGTRTQVRLLTAHIIFR